MSFRKWESVTSTGSIRTGNNKVFEELNQLKKNVNL